MPWPEQRETGAETVLAKRNIRRLNMSYYHYHTLLDTVLLLLFLLPFTVVNSSAVVYLYLCWQICFSALIPISIIIIIIVIIICRGLIDKDISFRWTDRPHHLTQMWKNKTRGWCAAVYVIFYFATYCEYIYVFIQNILSFNANSHCWRGCDFIMYFCTTMATDRSNGGQRRKCVHFDGLRGGITDSSWMTEWRVPGRSCNSSAMTVFTAIFYICVYINSSPSVVL